MSDALFRLATIVCPSVFAAAVGRATDAEVFYRDAEGRTVLYEVAKRGGACTIDALVDRGVDVCAKSIRGLTALHIAAWNGHASAVYTLIARGACVDSPSGEGETPLHHAIRSRSIECVQALLKGGADATRSDVSGKTPVHVAACVGDCFALQVLIESGVDISAQGTSDEPPLNLAVEHGHAETAAFIAHHTRVWRSNIGGVTALHVAAVTDRPGMATILINAGCPVDQKDDSGHSPLHYAAHSSSACVMALIRGGADANAKNPAGSSVVHWTAASCPASLKMVVRAGGDIHARDDEGHGPAHYAARGENVESLRVLALLGADMFGANTEGHTPLHLCCGPHLQCVRFLLYLGADPTALDGAGETPIASFVARGMNNAASLCVAFGAPAPNGSIASGALPFARERLRHLEHAEMLSRRLAVEWLAAGARDLHVVRNGPSALSRFVYARAKHACLCVIEAEATTRTVQTLRLAVTEAQRYAALVWIARLSAIQQHLREQTSVLREETSQHEAALRTVRCLLYV